MTAKEYLQKVKRHEIQIQHLMEELNEAREQAVSLNGINYESTKVQHSINPDKIPESLIRIEERQELLQRRIAASLDFQYRVSDEIGKLSKPVYIQIMHRRYIRFQAWKQIGGELGYNTRYVQQLHGSALTEFYEMYKEKYKFSGITVKAPDPEA